MNQIAGVDGFSLMNNLRLVVIVAIFIILIIVLFYNRVKRSPKRVKQKGKQAVNPSGDSSREERHATDVVGDFFGKEESKEKEKSKIGESAAEPEVEIEGRPADDSSREERDAPGALDDFFGIEESAEKEESKGGESTAESEVVIEDQPAVNYEKIEADLKAVRDEVATKIETDLKAVGEEVTKKIEGLILKVEAVEKEVLNKIEDVIDVKIQEASNKINDGISEAIRTQINSINPVSEEQVDSLRKEEVSSDIFTSEDAVVPEEIKEKEQTDTIVLSGGIEEKILVEEVGRSADFDIQNVLEEEPVSIPSTEEPKEFVKEKVESVDKKERDLEAPVKDIDIMEKVHLFVRCQLDAFDILPLDESKTVAEEKKERDLEVSSEVEEDVKVDEKESIEATTSTGKIEEKKSAGESVGPARLFFQKFLSAGKPSTEEPKEPVEEKVESDEKKERDLEASVEDRDILEKLAGSLQMNEDSFDVLPSGESKTVAEEKKEIDLEVPSEVEEDVKVDENEPIEAITSAGEIEEKVSEGDAGESVDFDIEKFLEEEPVGMPSTEEFKESVEEKVEIEEKKEGDLEAPVEDSDILEKLAGSLQMNEDSFDVLPSEESKTVAEEKGGRELEVPSEVEEDVKVDEKEPIAADNSTGKIEEKISEGESDDFDIEKLLKEEPVGIPSTEESMEVEEKVEFKFKEEKEEDLDLPAEETVANKGSDEKEIDTIAPSVDTEEKALEAAKGEEAEEKKQSTIETSDFDIQEFLEELGTPPSEKE